MQLHQALGTMTGITLALALVMSGCAGVQQEGPATADDAETAADTEADEDEMMADIDNYLEEEGEDANGEDQDKGGEDAAEGDANRPKETPKERTDQIYALIKAKRTSVSDCYNAAKKKDPKIGTKIAITILIGADGKLKTDPVVVEERTDIKNEEVRACAIDVVKSIEYPAHPKGMETTFTYPFGF